MRRLGFEFAGVVLAFTFVGCGETPQEAGPVPYKATSPAGLDKQLDVMSKNAQTKITVVKPKDAKAAEKKPEESKPEEKKK